VPLLTDAELPYGYNLRPDSPLLQYKSPNESDNAQLKSKVITAVEAACDRSELILQLAAALGEWFCYLKDNASKFSALNVKAITDSSSSSPLVLQERTAPSRTADQEAP
jgi:hypothetical protein